MGQKIRKSGSRRVGMPREGRLDWTAWRDGFSENPTLVARIRRRLNYSVLGLMALAVPLGYLVAYGSYGFRLAFGQISEWLHGVGRVSTGMSQMLLLAAGGLLFGLLLKWLRWERFRGPADVIVAEIMSQRFLAVPPSCTSTELRRLVGAGDGGDIFVVDSDDGRLTGVIPLAALAGEHGNRLAGEMSVSPSLCLEASTDLWSGFLAVGDFVGYAVPVVSDRDSMHLVGSVTEGDFIEAYRRTVEIIRADQEDAK